MAPTAQQRQRRLAFECAQDIALLSLLPQPLASPQPNTPRSAVPGKRSNRVLSFDRERSLTEALAFISSISDDPGHVVATCTEELSSGRGVKVLLAINRSDPDSHQPILDRIKSGLEVVFGLLARANIDDHAVLEGKILDAIVDLCKDRVLCRIRSKRADIPVSTRTATKPKPFAGVSNEQVLSAIHRHFFKPKMRSVVNTFIGHEGRFRDALNEVETCNPENTNKRLKDMLKAASKFVKNVDYRRVLDEITIPELNPNTKTAFISRMEKLARYRQISLYLLQTARRTHLFKNASVTAVSLGEDCFTRQNEIPQTSTFADCLSRCQAGVLNPPRVKTVCNKLDKEPSQFDSALKENLSKSRVHAEVQIITYYEFHPPPLYPRVISSGKDACYLCNAFIEAHGRFHVPRTHGRMYYNWRVPPVIQLNSGLDRLNKALEGHIRRTIARYMATPLPLGTAYPNESTLGPLSTSMSTLASFDVPVPTVASGSKTLAEVRSEDAQMVAKLGHDRPAASPELLPPPSPKLSVSQTGGTSGEPSSRPTETGRDSEEDATTAAAVQPQQQDNYPSSSGEVSRTPRSRPTSPRLLLAVPSVLGPIQEEDSSSEGKYSTGQEPSSQEDTSSEEEPSSPILPPAKQDVVDEAKTAAAQSDSVLLEEQLPVVQESANTAGSQPQKEENSLPGTDKKEVVKDDETATVRGSISAQQEPPPSPAKEDLKEVNDDSNSQRMMEEKKGKGKEEDGPEIGEDTLQREEPPTPNQEDDHRTASTQSSAPSNDDDNTPEPAKDKGNGKVIPAPAPKSEFRSSSPLLFEQQRQEGNEVEDNVEILIQGQISTLRLDTLPTTKRQTPRSYRTGKGGMITIYPEFVTTTSSLVSRKEIVELRIEWLLPPPTQQQQQQPQENQKHKRPPAEYNIGFLPIFEDVDTGSKDCVRLVHGNGDVVMIEVVRT
ncbi:hypothetical protein B0H66DRAFT_36839 [Apodospora peruviana]|uniref:Uncharacterized protein n=1 Tax=Apodospora peruviana TaxID=516989 RepID=A0AAE0IRG5_9PEZI|nr:hypothetical protein B0H66DRAFT_36839 [Apodospora peruviana]